MGYRVFLVEILNVYLARSAEGVDVERFELEHLIMCFYVNVIPVTQPVSVWVDTSRVILRIFVHICPMDMAKD